MLIKSVQFRSRLYPYLQNDCAVVRMLDKDSQHIEIAFPFHEDTPNFILTIPEALDLRNAIDQLIDIKLLKKPREEIK